MVTHLTPRYYWPTVFALIIVAFLVRNDVALASPPAQVLPRTGAYLGDRVWEDLNANGIQDDGEPGIPGISLKLVNATTGERINRIQVTDENGNYAFFFDPLGPCPPCTSVYIEVDQSDLLSAGYTITRQYQVGVSDVFNSDFSQIDGRTAVIPIMWRYLYANFDLGLVRIPECAAAYDLSLTLDFSTDISNGTNNIEYLKYFAQAITRSFTINQDATQIGVTSFAAGNNPNSQNSAVEVALNAYPDDRDALIERIGQITRLENRRYNATSLYEGLRVSDTMLRTQGRSDAEKIILVVTDGQDNEPGDPIGEAARIKRQGTKIYVVKLNLTGVLEVPSRTNARMVATDDQPPYLFEDIGQPVDLMSVLSDVVINVCQPLPSAPVRNYFMTSTPVLTWSRVDWAEGYRVEVYRLGETEPAFSAEVGQFDLQVETTPLADRQYNWRVRAILSTDPKVYGPWSAMDSFLIDAVPG
jgi:hypothetical protein